MKSRLHHAVLFGLFLGRRMRMAGHFCVLFGSKPPTSSPQHRLWVSTCCKASLFFMIKMIKTWFFPKIHFALCTSPLHKHLWYSAPQDMGAKSPKIPVVSWQRRVHVCSSQMQISHNMCSSSPQTQRMTLCSSGRHILQAEKRSSKSETSFSCWVSKNVSSLFAAFLSCWPIPSLSARIPFAKARDDPRHLKSAAEEYVDRGCGEHQKTVVRKCGMKRIRTYIFINLSACKLVNLYVGDL